MTQATTGTTPAATSLARAHAPVIGSYVFLVATGTIAFLLRVPGNRGLANPDCSCRTDTLGRTEWQIWVATVSAGLAIALLLAFRGAVRLRRVPQEWPDDAGGTTARVVVRALAAVLWVIMLGVAAGLLVHDPRAWPAPIDMEWRLVVVPAVGLLCAAPWVALTWLSHDAVHSLDVRAKQSPGRDGLDGSLATLQRIWQDVVAIALALAVLVAVSLIPTGALRNLWLSKGAGHDKAFRLRLEAAFTSTDVLLYGAMWAFVAAVVVIPLVASWRASAQSVVDAAYPPNATTAASAADLAMRHQLEALLSLDAGILRNPLTVLTIATPLVTASLAAFVPQIGS